MKAKTFILFYFLLLYSNSFSQNNPNGFQFWRLTSFSGEARIRGLYREQEVIRGDFIDKQKSSLLSGGALLNTKSFFLHPNFLILDVDASYYPETSRNDFIVVQDQAEVRNLKKLDLTATLFSQKKITLSTFANFDESYQNREYITDLKSNSKQWGGALFYSNKFLPLSADFRKRQWEQKEVETGRKVSIDERVFQSRTSKSFTSRDKHELSYSRNEFINQNVFTEQDENLYLIKGTIENTNLNSNIFLDEKRNYSFNSMISNINQQGNINFKRFQALESVALKLPKKFTFNNNYNFFLTRQALNNLSQHSIQSSLAHQLYLSLNTRLFFEHNRMKHTAYREYTNRTGIDIKYVKKIPAGGQLSLSYMYFLWHQNMDSDPTSLQTTNEEYILSDNEITLLKRPDINTASVVVRDATGIITYQINLDYMLIDINSYLQILRIPGGQIANNATVYIDYTSTQSGSFKYDMNNHSFTANVLLFKGKLEVYYRFSAQDLKNLSTTEMPPINYFTQNVLGARLDFGFINGGAEYDDFKSSIIPYRRVRYFINIQKNYHQKIFLTLNGNIQDFQIIMPNETLPQKYSDVTGKIAYTIFKQTKINLDLMYRNQRGRGLDLDLLTAGSEITSVIRQLYVTFGVELYRRNFLGMEKINFRGTYISIARRF